MLNRILSRIDALERRPIDSPCARISDEEIARGAVVFLDVPAGVMDRAAVNGVSVADQCYGESERYREIHDRYNGRLVITVE